MQSHEPKKWNEKWADFRHSADVIEKSSKKPVAECRQNVFVPFFRHLTLICFLQPQVFRRCSQLGAFARLSPLRSLQVAPPRSPWIRAIAELELRPFWVPDEAGSHGRRRTQLPPVICFRAGASRDRSCRC